MSDPTDPGGVTGGHERSSRNSTRTGDSGSPVGSPLTIVLAVIAVAAGFLIFRSISDDNSDAGGLVPTSAAPAPGGGATTTAGGTAPAGGTVATPATTAGVRVTDGATVIVANASGVSGSAGTMSDELEAAGYTMEGPTDDDSDEPLEETVVYFVVGTATEAVAQSVARDLGNVEVQPMPDPIPTSDGSIGAAAVLVLLGSDTAGQSLEELTPPAAPAAPSVATTTTTSA